MTPSYMSLSKTGPTNVTNDNFVDKDSADGDDAKPLDVLRSRDPNVLTPSASRKLDLAPLVDAALAKFSGLLQNLLLR